MNLTPNFTPLRDLILVLPDAPPDKVGSIFIPGQAKQYGDQPGRSEDGFTGTVVAVGPGDRHTPLLSIKCPVCAKPWKYVAICDASHCECSPMKWLDQTHVNAWDASRYPMQTKVGDRVVYPRRPTTPGGTELTMIDGVGYLMFAEEQFAYAIIEA